MTKTSDDRYGAFCTHDPVRLSGAPSGPLAGLRFAAKDAFDVKGQRICGGNPDWLRTHDPAASTAPAVQALLDAGADLAGKTQMDELAYSINGENHFYGTPLNPRNPNRIPGGSSSGSAVAVAAGLVDFSLGTDTAGSVRLPGSFCGIHGLRPSHGAVSIAGCLPLAPSYDTVGWFARDLSTLARVARVLLPARASGLPERLLIATDAFALASEPIRGALAPHVDRLRARFARVEEIVLGDEGLFSWQQTMRALQGYEVWQTHGEWIARVKPAFGPGIRERFQWAATIAREDALAASARREQISQLLDALLDGAALCMPTVPFVAPVRNAATAEQDRTGALSLLCVASLGRLPQITLPVATADGCQVGLSLLGRRGTDLPLLELAAQVS
jgi:amidase